MMRKKLTSDHAPPWRCARCLRCPPHVRRHGQRPTCARCAADLAARGRKWCRQCNQALPIEAFAPIGGGGRRGTCRACYAPRRREIATPSMRRWRERNRERIRSYNRAYRRARPDAVRRWNQAGYIRRKLRILRGGMSHASH